MSNRQEKIHILARMNYGRAAAPSFFASLSEALGELIEASALVPLSESDVLLELFRNRYQRAINGSLLSYREFFRGSDARRVVSTILCKRDSRVVIAWRARGS